MKPILLLLLISFTAQAQDWQNLDSPDYYIEYPDQWTLDDSGNYNTQFMLFSPQTSNEDSFRENVNLIVQDLSNYDFDLESYTKLSLQQLTRMFADANIINTQNHRNSDGEYREIIYSATQNNKKLKWKQYYWVQNDMAYILTFTAEEAKFDTYIDQATKVLKSFRIK